MKNLFISIVLIFSFSLTYCQKSNFGIGIIVGDPTGISAKFWIGDNSAFDAAAAWDIAGGNDALLLHADYLKHNLDLVSVKKGQIPLYYGIGMRIILLNEIHVAARVPLGVSYIFDDIPIDSFLEIVPVLNILPSIQFDVDAAIGIRYYF